MRQIVARPQLRFRAQLSGLFVIGAAILVVVLLRSLQSGATPGANPYSVDITPGLAVSRSADSIALIVSNRLEAMGAELGRSLSVKVVSLKAVPGSELSKAEPQTGSAVGPEASRAYWVIRATGPFYSNRTPPGKPAITADAGYFIVDDLTGEIVGMGMP